MDTAQNTMPLLINPRAPLLRRSAPRQKHNTSRPNLAYRINNLLCKALPSPIRVAVCLVRADGETSVQEEDASIGPGGEEAAVFGGRLEARVVF